MTLRATTISIATAALLFVPACSKSEKPERKATPTPVTKVMSPENEANEIWSNTCEGCHGPTGLGNGARADGIDAMPTNFQDPQWQKATSDDAIRRVIVQGGAAVGKAEEMEANPALAHKPQVLNHLVKKLRGFAK